MARRPLIAHPVLRSFVNFKIVMRCRRKEFRGTPKARALGHSLFGQCINPSLTAMHA